MNYRPDRLLENLPEYTKITQKTLARRFLFKAAGRTAVSGKLDESSLMIPIEIHPYSQALVSLGKTRSENPQDSCASCHGSITEQRTAFLKHSSDSLAFWTDTQLIDLVKNSQYPDGSLLIDGKHAHAMASEQEETAIVAWLRNMPVLGI